MNYPETTISYWRKTYEKEAMVAAELRAALACVDDKAAIAELTRLISGHEEHAEYALKQLNQVNQIVTAQPDALQSSL